MNIKGILEVRKQWGRRGSNMRPRDINAKANRMEVETEVVQRKSQLV